MKKKPSRSQTGRAVVAVQPSIPSQPKTVVTGVTGVVPLVPPIERALNQFADELRKELSAARDQILALQSELASLRTRYENHTHGYTRTITGSGGTQWFSLGHLKHYLDEDKGNFDGWGAYFREGGVTGSAPEIRTGPPGP